MSPVLEFFRSYFGITEHGTEREARDKIAGRMVLLDETLTEGLPIVFDFLGVPDLERPAPPLGPEGRKRQLFGVIRRLARARSAREPAVYLFEDLHCFDRASEEFIENLIEISPGNRTLVLLNFRPEYHAGWMQRSYYQQLPLLPLGTEEIGALLGDLLGADASLRHLRELIQERTGGNPFFIEETIQSDRDGRRRGSQDTTVEAALRHPLMRRAAAAGAAHRHESPVFHRLADGTLAEAVVDLAFREHGVWSVVGYNTDREIGGRRAEYERQVAVYARAIGAASRGPSSAALLIV